MSNLRISNRYAEALMTSAEELKILSSVSDDLLKIKSVVDESKEFRLFLKSPIIKKEKKKEVFDATFGKLVQPVTMQFLTLLTEKGREDVLPSVIEAFFRLQDEKLGVVNVNVKSATELSDGQIAELKKRFEEHSKKKVKIKIQQDKKLIGGFVARVGDTMFDGSLKHQLEVLRKQFVAEVAKN